MSEWITDREPHYRDDGYYVFNAYGKVVHWAQIQRGEAWMPIVSPEPYVKTKGGDAMKLCKDCKHHHKSVLYDFCERNAYVRDDGFIQNDDSRWCNSERKRGFIAARFYGTCGREGRFFQPKDTPNDTP